MTTTARPGLDAPALDQLFREGRTYTKFRAQPIGEDQIHALYDLVRWGPTAFNAQPGRFVFIRTPAARDRLAACVSGSNRPKVQSAALNVIVAQDLGFARHLPRFTANPNAQALFTQYPELVEPTALRSASLQAGYLLLAARALGLDVGVLTGFDSAALQREFLAGEPQWQANLVMNLGVGDPEALAPRFPRHAFDEVARIL